MIFYEQNGQQYARKYAKARNPRTSKQRRQRARFAKAAKEWAKLSGKLKAEYDRRARGCSGFNVFMKEKFAKR